MPRTATPILRSTMLTAQALDRTQCQCPFRSELKFSERKGTGTGHCPRPCHCELSIVQPSLAAVVTVQPSLSIYSCIMAKFPFGGSKRTAKEPMVSEFRGVHLLSLGGAHSGLHQKTSSTSKDLLPAANKTLMCHASTIVATAKASP
eukprot:845905-Rhodomonas_salina.2